MALMAVMGRQADSGVWICHMSFMCLGGLDAFWIWEGGQGPRSKSTSGKGGVSIWNESGTKSVRRSGTLERFRTV
jgi:hypothetical protein